MIGARQRRVPGSRQALDARHPRRAQPKVIDPTLLTQTERIQHDGFLLRQDNNRIIKAMAAAGMPIKKIARQTRRSRKLAGLD